MVGGVVAAHPATKSDASIARLANFIVDLKLNVCVRPRRNGFRTLRANALDGAASVQMSGRPYKRCILAAYQRFSNVGDKAAGDSAVHVRTVDRHGMRRRAVDLAAVVCRFLTIGMFLVHIRFGRPGRIFMVANVAAGVVRRFLDLERHTGAAVKTGGVRASEKARLERRHD